MEFSELIRTCRAQAKLLRGREGPPQSGTLCVTGHYLLLSSGPQETPDLWLLLLRSVASIEKRVAGDSGTITLRCKDLRVLQLDIEGVEATLDIARSIEALSSLESAITSFPFFYRPRGLRLGDAWHFHPPECHYKRVARETNAWRLSEVNEDFSLCPSYPRAVIVPSAVDDDDPLHPFLALFGTDAVQLAPDRTPEVALRRGRGAAVSCPGGISSWGAGLHPGHALGSGRQTDPHDRRRHRGQGRLPWLETAAPAPGEGAALTTELHAPGGSLSGPGAEHGLLA
ncbi:Myotubularin-related protein 9 [Manis javanica]|nr:Myotubularin-related protein 9 [Manis javanica]